MDEEDGNVVSDHVPVTLFGVHLQSKSTDISDGVGGTSASKDGGESQKDGCLAGRICENAGRGQLRDGLMESKGTKGTSTSGVDHSLGNTLMIETMDLQVMVY